MGFGLKKNRRACCLIIEVHSALAAAQKLAMRSRAPVGSGNLKVMCRKKFRANSARNRRILKGVECNRGGNIPPSTHRPGASSPSAPGRVGLHFSPHLPICGMGRGLTEKYVNNCCPTLWDGVLPSVRVIFLWCGHAVNREWN
jgi:hypothetical protein